MRQAWPLAFLAFAGCGESAVPPAIDTGAKTTAQSFYDAVIARDVARAYELLDTKSRERTSRESFAQQVAAYHRILGFVPDRAIIRSCDEHEDSATVHSVLIGKGGGHSGRYQDGITLRREGDRWLVVLPPRFGMKLKS